MCTAIKKAGLLYLRRSLRKPGLSHCPHSRDEQHAEAHAGMYMMPAAHYIYEYKCTREAEIYTCPGRRCCFALDCAVICEIQVCQEPSVSSGRCHQCLSFPHPPFATSALFYRLRPLPFGRELGAKLILFCDASKLFTKIFILLYSWNTSWNTSRLPLIILFSHECP